MSNAKKPRLDINTATASTTEILAALEQDQSGSGDALDIASARRLLSQVEKKYEKNREHRIKYAEEPEKFMESEAELNDAVQEFHAVAAQPELYSGLVKHGLLTIISLLLAHENTDIVAITCSLLQELTDANPMYENEDGLDALINGLLSEKVFDHIWQTLKRLNEEDRDESDAVNNLLTTVENILENNISAYEGVVSENLFEWLVTRASKRGTFDTNKLYASQLLSETLQNSEFARERLVQKANGLDMILRALSVYKRSDPDTKDEVEHMENLFDALCAALLHTPNRKLFLDGEGPQLMNLMLREKKLSRHGALKVMSHATAIPDGKDNCEKFVEIYGLRTLFSMLMRTPTGTKKKDTTPDEHEEHVVSIVDALLFQCSPQSHARVIQKFTEHEYEKVDRLVELLLNYKNKVEKYANLLKKGLQNEIDSTQLRIELLNNGMYTWQRIGLVLAEVCTKGPPECLQRANKLLKMKLKTSVESLLTAHLKEWQQDFEESPSQSKRIRRLISALEHNK